jgi:trigger factor
MSGIQGIKFEINDISPVFKDIEVQIPWPEVLTRLNKRYGEIRRTMRPLKGFRKGKVPQWILEQQFGQQVEADVMQELLNDGLLELLNSDESLAPVATHDVKPQLMQKGQPYSFAARLEVRPKLETVDFVGLNITRTVHEITDEDIESTIANKREEAANLQAPDPKRPAKVGDVLTIDYSVVVEGKDDGSKTEEQEVEIGKGRLPNDIEQGLIGLEVGEEKDIPFNLPEQNKEIKGMVSFHVKVKDIQEKVLPPVDDELAKDLGHDNLEELRASIRADLQKQLDSMSENSIKDQLLNALCDANPIDVPPSMVNQEAEGHKAYVAQMLHVDLEKNPFNEEQEGQMVRTAEHKVRLSLLLAEVSKREGLVVTDGEIDAKMSEIASDSGEPLPKVRADFNKNDQLDQLRGVLLHQKVVDYILSKAVIKDRRPDEVLDEADSAAAVIEGSAVTPTDGVEGDGPGDETTLPDANVEGDEPTSEEGA